MPAFIVVCVKTAVSGRYGGNRRDATQDKPVIFSLGVNDIFALVVDGSLTTLAY